MTKNQYVDVIRNIVDPTGRNPRFRPQQIEACIDMIYGEFTMSLPPSKYDEFDFLTKEYVSQTVTWDATTGRYYAALPAAVVPLRIPSEGVRHIGTNLSTSLDFCPMTETTWELYEGLITHQIDTTIGYIVRYNRVWFNESMTADIASAGIRMVLAVPFMEFDYAEEVNLPMGGINLIRSAVDLLNGTAPANLKNDNK